MQAHGIGEQRPELLRRLRLGEPRASRAAGIAYQRCDSISPVAGPSGRRSRRNSRAGAGRRPRTASPPCGPLIPAARKSRTRADSSRSARPGRPQQLLDLRGEGEPAPIDRPVERLDAEAVARREQRSGRARPRSANANMPRKRSNAVFAPLRDRRASRTSVSRVGARTVPLRPQLLAQLEVVVDLAVEDEMEAAGGVGHRLQPGLAQIDDREPPVPERHRAGRRSELAPPRSVRPAMRDTVDSRPLRGEGDGCVEAAHGSARPGAEFLVRMERKAACSGRATRRRRLVAAGRRIACPAAPASLTRP